MFLCVGFLSLRNGRRVFNLNFLRKAYFFVRLLLFAVLVWVEAVLTLLFIAW